MPEPVMCPSCGRTLPDYPAGGKCPNCGATIPTPAGQPPQDIDAEISRLTETGKTCPTCGRALPAGSAVCPFCHVEAEPVVRRGIPAWVKLLIVLGFAIVATTVTVVYMRRWGHEQHVSGVKDDLAKAKKASAAKRFGDAVRFLQAARRQLEWFEEIDPDRGTLLAEISRTHDSLRTTGEETIQDLIKRGLVTEAKTLYDEIKAIDEDKSLEDVISKAVANREIMREFQKARRDAEKLHEDGALAEALKQISLLRNKVEDPLKAKGPAMAELRSTVGKLQSAWVTEAYDKGNEFIHQGKLSEAAKWFKLSEIHVWSNEVGLRRRIKEAIYHISDNRVVGVFLNVTKVRVVKVEDVRSELQKRLEKKLDDEGFLTLILKGTGDPAANELHRMVVVNYKEEQSREFTSSDMLEKAMGTKITCELKVLPTKGGEPLWKQMLTKQTTGGGAVQGGINEANLRLNALRAFWRALEGTHIPPAHLLP
ncbi:MAG: hypothetical protein AMS16_05480 [Planctomycetes bacterium DG_58]|nr:MAG: hypothetical protein AMS16_05480 [Planctomycetes bacterium DG_58]KPL04849.1 MAG: hypothetical protein AMK75_00295 [Planctomycetes bacterium SM23_65]